MNNNDKNLFVRNIIPESRIVAKAVQSKSGLDIDEALANISEYDKVIPTDLKFNNDGKMVLMHDTKIITKQTPLDLGEMKGPIMCVVIDALDTATQGTITQNQLNILQKSRLNIVEFNNELYTLNDLGHIEGSLTYSHVGAENNRIFIKCFTITLNTLAWVLTIRPIPELDYDENTKTLNIID